jgi:cell division protein FtsB
LRFYCLQLSALWSTSLQHKDQLETKQKDAEALRATRDTLQAQIARLQQDLAKSAFSEQRRQDAEL